MIKDYFTRYDYEDVKKQRKKCLTVFCIIAGVYALLSVALIIYYTTLPYQSPTIFTVKLIHYVLTFVSVVIFFIYLGIPFKRVNSFYKVSRNIVLGIREKSEGVFIEYSEEVQHKDGVEFKSLVFLEWDEKKKSGFERKVLVFNERPFPEIEPQSMVRYITQGNILVMYEIIQEEL